jgi:P4 family phage/plasmid primase-like protien
MTISIKEMLSGIFHTSIEGAHPIVAGFAADPKSIKPKGVASDPAKWADWRPYAVIDGEQPDCLMATNNIYFGLSSVRPDSSGRIKASQKLVAALHAVMVDDLGSGSGSKGSLDGLKLSPSWVLETSPDNYQAGYILQQPEKNTRVAAALVEGVAPAVGGDPGATNRVRWTRGVEGVNSKARVVEEHGSPFATRLIEWHPERRYTPEEIAGAYGFNLPDESEPPVAIRHQTAPVVTSDHLAEWLGGGGHLTGEVSEDGWLKFGACPWTHEHTDQEPSGAAYGPPDTGTGEDGEPIPVARFHCCHGHCAERKLPELIEWAVAEGYPLPNELIIHATTEMLSVMLEEVIEKTATDDGYCYEDRPLLLLKVMKQRDFSDYRRLRTRLKKANSFVSVVELDKAVARVSLGNGLGGEERAPDHLEIAREVIEWVGKDNVLFAQSAFWRWDASGVWSMLDDYSLKQSIHATMERKYPFEPVTNGRTAGVLDASKTETFLQGHEFNLDKDRINVLNGELSRVDGKWALLTHDRGQYRTTQLPVEYEPGATAPRFIQFLREIFEPDEEQALKVQLVCELLGYSLMSHCRFEKFIMMIGEGANGKSVLLAVLEALVGRRNVAAVQPSEFANKFQRAHLQDKLANIVSELKEGAVIDDNALKAITSGEVTTVERKHKDPFDLHPFSTCWFGANHLPHTRDFSDALFRRAVVIPFNRVFTENEQDKKLKDSLLDELPGILNLALDAFGAVIDRGIFTHVNEVEKAKGEWRREIDQVHQFVDDECELGAGFSITSTLLYQKYREWSFDQGITRMMSQRGMTNRLKRFGVRPGKSGNSRKLFGIRTIKIGRFINNYDVLVGEESSNNQRTADSSVEEFSLIS